MSGDGVSGDGVRVGAVAAEQVAEAVARRATGAEIARLREGLRLTHGELAHRAGVTETLVRRYERGNAVLVDLWQLRCLAAVLGVTAGELVDAGCPVHRPTVPGPGERGPGTTSVFVLASVTEDPVGIGWRLIRWDPQPIGTHWQATATQPAITRPVLNWASQRLGGSAYIAGPANDLMGARSWYLGTLGPRTTGPSVPPAPGSPGATG